MKASANPPNLIYEITLRWIYFGTRVPVPLLIFFVSIQDVVYKIVHQQQLVDILGIVVLFCGANPFLDLGLHVPTSRRDLLKSKLVSGAPSCDISRGSSLHQKHLRLRTARSA
jgi:hypothetical protein